MNYKHTYILFLLAIFSAVSTKMAAQEEINVKPIEIQKTVTENGVKKVLYFPTLQSVDEAIYSLNKNLNFESVKKTLDNQIKQAKRKKRPVDDLEKQFEVCENGISALQATNKIVFIDSVVVDKHSLLSAYKFDSELGTLTLSADKETCTFTTELGNRMYKAEKMGDNISIYSYYIEDGVPTNKSPLRGFELLGDQNYPFLLSDGVTLYFASRNVGGHGNYDLYVTRYDSEEGTYLQPTNLGFPFNSYANDYMMIIDEDLGIGWFASDRNQPEDKVCIYTFLQPKSRITYDYETDDRQTIINAARISSIKNTWHGNEDAIRTARQKLTLKLNEQDEATNYDFTFVINNNKLYHSLSDFTSKEARECFKEYQTQQQHLNSLKDMLTRLRRNAKGETIRAQILKIESEVSEAAVKLNEIAKKVRSLELK